METTFDKFITNNPTQKELFDKEYAEFARSERLLESGYNVSATTKKHIVNRRRAYELA